MNVNQKGVTGLIKVIDDLHERGYYVFIPFDDHSPVDLIAMNDEGNTVRIQIKYRQKKPGLLTERYELAARSVIEGKHTLIDKDMIDGWALFLADSDKVTYIHKNVLGDKYSLSVDPSVEYGELAEWFKAPAC